MPIIYYGSRISPHITRTPEGYLICHDVPINRTGTYKYLGAELGLTGADADKEFTVLRRPEEVFSPATLASFEGKPTTSDHPPEDVTPDNYAYYAKGHAQNVRRGTGQSSNNSIADLIITDPQLIEDVEKNGKREISCGYNFDLFQNPNGVYEQRNMRGNHVAIVPEGRAGHDVAIKDSKPNTERRKEDMAKDEKGSGFWGRIFRGAAKDASVTDEDLENAVKEIGKKGEVPVKDEDIEEPNPLPSKKDPEKAPAKDELPGAGVESKLDELLALLKPICAELAKGQGEETHDELEDLINSKHEAGEGPEKETQERATGEEDEDEGPEGTEEDVVVQPEDVKGDDFRGARDSAKQAASVVRSILAKQYKNDPAAYKAKAKDAAVEIRKAYGLDKAPDKGYGRFVSETKKSQAARAAQDSLDENEKAAAEAQKAYDARNPHKKKEAK